MTGTPKLNRWIAPIAWSVGLLAVVLVGSIVSVKMLPDDAITLAGGIAVFAISIIAWFALTATMMVRQLRTVRTGQVEPSPSGPSEVERPPLINR